MIFCVNAHCEAQKILQNMLILFSSLPQAKNTLPAQLILEVAFLCWNEMLPTALLIFNITVLNEQQIPDQNKMAASMSNDSPQIKHWGCFRSVPGVSKKILDTDTQEKWWVILEKERIRV